MNSLSKVFLSRSAFAHNVKLLRGHLDSNQKICFCVKANAYGHDLIQMTKIAIEAGLEWVSVIDTMDAVSIRQAGLEIPILHLGYVSKEDLPEMIKLGVRLNVWNLQQVYQISKLAQELRQTALIHISVETGMGRLGILPSELIGFIKQVNKLPYIMMEGLSQHYATSDEPNSKLFFDQRTQFQATIKQLASKNWLPKEIHASNSGAILLHPALAEETMIRVGALLYGFAADRKMQEELLLRNLILKPVLTWKTQLISKKYLPAGSNIGYGGDKILRVNTLVGVIPVGYHEGLDRRLSAKGSVLIRAKFCKILGRICMNLAMVDLSEVPEVELGEDVVLIGRQNQAKISLEDVAKWTDTIPYEICVHLTNPCIEVVE